MATRTMQCPRCKTAYATPKPGLQTHNCLADEILYAYAAYKAEIRQHFNVRAEIVYCTQCTDFEFVHPDGRYAKITSREALLGALGAALGAHAAGCGGIRLKILRQKLNRYREHYDRLTFSCTGCGLDLSAVGPEDARRHVENGCPWSRLGPFLESARKIRPGALALRCRVCKSEFQNPQAAAAHDKAPCESNLTAGLPPPLRRHFAIQDESVYCLSCVEESNGHWVFDTPGDVERHALEGCIRVHGKRHTVAPY